MKKKLMASVLLAVAAVSFPAYAGHDRTPDEYNPDTTYKSPLDLRNAPIVNDYPRPGSPDESEAFAAAAGQLVQGNAGGKSGKKDTAAAEAEKKAEEILSKTDTDFEPSPDKEYPGHEYQANRLGQPVKPAVRELTGKEAAAESKQVPAAVKNSKTSAGKAGASNLPLIITGDDAQYANDSGDFVIEGNVRLVQGETAMESSKAVGNAKTGDVWLLQGGSLLTKESTVKARWAHYNFNKKTGELRSIAGESRPDKNEDKKDFFSAPHGIIENGRMIIDQGGSYTRCPAVENEPCLSVKAGSITIIPNERVIARNVKVFARGKHIYSRDVWTQNLAGGSSQLVPHIGWKKHKGLYVSVDYERPIGNPKLKNPTTVSMHQVYYTKSKYKPFYGIRHDEPDFYVRLNSGYIFDEDDEDEDEGIWLHKKIDWGLFLKPHRIARGLPLAYEGNITHGLWKYTNQGWSSWHTEKVIRLRHDRFYPLGGKKLYTDLMAGRKWVDESTAGTEATRKHGKNLSTNIFHGTIGYEFSKKWNIWETFHNEHMTSYNFTMNQPKFSKEWRTGITWKPDDHNTVTVVNRYNGDRGSLTHGNYSTKFIWSHRFCCEVLSVEYERKHYRHGNDWSVTFDIANW